MGHWTQNASKHDVNPSDNNETRGKFSRLKYEKPVLLNLGEIPCGFGQSCNIGSAAQASCVAGVLPKSNCVIGTLPPK